MNQSSSYLKLETFATENDISGKKFHFVLFSQRHEMSLFNILSFFKEFESIRVYEIGHQYCLLLLWTNQKDLFGYNEWHGKGQ